MLSAGTDRKNDILTRRGSSNPPVLLFHSPTPWSPPRSHVLALRPPSGRLPLSLLFTQGWRHPPSLSARDNPFLGGDGPRRSLVAMTLRFHVLRLQFPDLWSQLGLTHLEPPRPNDSPQSRGCHLPPQTRLSPIPVPISGAVPPELDGPRQSAASFAQGLPHSLSFLHGTP